MCEYCSSKCRKSLLVANDIEFRLLFIDKKEPYKGWCLAIAVGCGIVSVPIRYCPKCGRNLAK